jgi:Fe-S-cluster-containing dehydrogenase component/DMSO reductase anchor subunit
MPTSFIFDTNKCTGCQACRLACTIENGLGLDCSWRKVFTFNERQDPAAPLFHLSLACNHCADPACMGACPALAYSKDPLTGVVLLDSGKCIGCKYCSWACPYDAPEWDATAGVMSKCTFCNDRLAQGLAPACATACPTGALEVADRGTGALSNHVEGFPQTDLGPSIDILPLRAGGAAPDASAPPPVEPRPRGSQPLSSRITLRSEWSLMAFSLLAAVLFGMLSTAAVAGRYLHPLLFLAVGLSAMTLSAAHLGRRLRAWRAVLNVANSWLSREIVCFSLFVGLGTLYLTALRSSSSGARPVAGGWAGALGWMALAFGLLTLISIDRVYDFAIRPVPGLPHSAGALLTGLFLAGLMLRSPILAGLAWGLKLGLYMARKLALRGHEAGTARPFVSALRVGVGLLLPAAASLASSGDGPTRTLILVAALVGELIDRAEFYDELEIMTPARQMADDLGARVAAVTGSTGSRLP